MKKLKDIDYKILAQLIKNSRLSDRQIAKILGVSQPTVTRRRTILERERLLDFTAVPDLKKLGFEILAFTCANWKHENYPDERTEETKAFLSKHPNVIFVSTGRGLTADRITVSVHKNYADYYTFMQELRQEWGSYVGKIDSFIVSLQSDTILRNLAFKYLADVMKKYSE